jgi:hypothetical protein
MNNLLINLKQLNEYKHFKIKLQLSPLLPKSLSNEAALFCFFSWNSSQLWSAKVFFFLQDLLSLK